MNDDIFVNAKKKVGNFSFILRASIGFKKLAKEPKASNWGFPNTFAIPDFCFPNLAVRGWRKVNCISSSAIYVFRFNK